MPSQRASRDQGLHIVSGISPCRARKQTEFEKRKAAFAKLIGLVMSMMKRRPLYEVLPLDPTAWPVLLAAHREELRHTMAEQAALNKVDLSTMKAPGAKASTLHEPIVLTASQANVEHPVSCHFHM